MPTVQPFGAFLRRTSGSGSLSGLSETLGYGFYGASPVRYSHTLFVGTGGDISAAACATGTVRMRPTDAPAYQTSSLELQEWYDEAIMEGLLNEAANAGADVDEVDALLGRFATISLYLHPQDQLALTAPGILTECDGAGGSITGEKIQCIVYRNLAPRSVFEALADSLRTFILNPVNLRPKLPATLQAEDKAELFAFFFFWTTNQALPVSLGDALGKGKVFSGKPTVGIEVWHRDGPVDPVYFFEAMKTARLMASDQSQRWDETRSALSVNGKIFDPSVDTARVGFAPPAAPDLGSPVFAQHIVPYPVLTRLRAVTPPDATKWRDLGTKQVKLYRDRLHDLMLLRRYQVKEPGRPGPSANDDTLLSDEIAAMASHPELAPFQFNNADWRNVFQLEAVAEFYLNCPEPLNDATNALTDPTNASYRHVNLLGAASLTGIPRWIDRGLKAGACAGTNSDLYFVQIDDFRLVGGILPLQKLRARAWKGEAIDTYSGMMFIIKRGEVFSKHRFTSYTSRKHTKLRARSSITGNVEYGFMSFVARGSDSINYSFIVLDRASFDFKPPLTGRTYFDATPIRAQEKASIMIHQGGRERSSGSEGCQVDDKYPEFRKAVIQAVLDDPAEVSRLQSCYPNDPIIVDLLTIRDLTHRHSADYWKAASRLFQADEAVRAGYPDNLDDLDGIECLMSVGVTLDRIERIAAGIPTALAERLMLDNVYVRFDEWDAAIYGVYYLIRPTERHVGWQSSP